MPREGDTVLGLNAEKLTRLGGVYVRVDPRGGLLGEINVEVLDCLMLVVKSMKLVSQSFDQVISTLTDDAWGQVVKNW